MAINSRVRLYGTALFTGILSISSYILLYTHQDWVTRNFTRGGVYAVLPIATAFYFSFVHGTFTSCLLHGLGVRAARGPVADKTRPAGDPPQGKVRP